MITKEMVKKYNGTELMYQLDWMVRPVHSVMLVSEALGCSIKPVFESDEEEAHFINDHMHYYDDNVDDMIAFYDRPDFCFSASSNCIDYIDLDRLLTGRPRSALNNKNFLRCPMY